MMKNCIKFLVISFLMVAVSGCTTMTTVRHSEGYSDILQRQKEMVVLPANVEVSTVDIGSKQTRMYDYEMYLEDEIKVALTDELKNYGFRVKSLSRRQIHEQNLRTEVARISSSYRAVREELYANGAMIDENKALIAANIGPAAIELGNRTGGEIILLIDYVGTIKTNGARARDFMVSLLVNNANISRNADDAHIVIGIIDARTGQLLWTNWAVHSEDLYSSMISNMSSQKKMDHKRLQLLAKQLLSPWAAKNNKIK